MDFIKDFKKSVEKQGLRVGSSEPPRYWFSFGNYVLNRIISGDFKKGVPQGRITCLAGPSGTGKSFLASNVMREAQKEDAMVVVLDSENALDDDFVSKIGVDVKSENYHYIPVSTIPQVERVISAFVNGYKKEYPDTSTAPKVLFVIDSLDMLMTEKEEEDFEKGVVKGDQGQRSKQLKKALREFVQNIKDYNISMIVTHQVYKNQSMFSSEEWVVAEALKYSLSQILLLNKYRLSGEAKGDVTGIRMKCEGYKTRFTKPFQTVNIEVPYETGMDPYNGMIDVAKELGVITIAGAWYTTVSSGDKWQSKNFVDVAETVLADCEKKTSAFLVADETNVEIDLTANEKSSKSKRAEKAQKQ